MVSNPVKLYLFSHWFVRSGADQKPLAWEDAPDATEEIWDILIDSHFDTTPNFCQGLFGVIFNVIMGHNKQ